jgi:hypothetical protein
MLRLFWSTNEHKLYILIFHCFSQSYCNVPLRFLYRNSHWSKFAVATIMLFNSLCTIASTSLDLSGLNFKVSCHGIGIPQSGMANHLPHHSSGALEHIPPTLIIVLFSFILRPFTVHNTTLYTTIWKGFVCNKKQHILKDPTIEVNSILSVFLVVVWIVFISSMCSIRA